MKEINNDEFDNTLNAVNTLSEEDAKSMLKIIYGFINTALTGNGGDKVKLEVLDCVSDIYKRIPESNVLEEDK